jgi:hypothetical protein
MKSPNPTLLAGVCAGGYFAAAALYVGNAVAMAANRSANLTLALAMGFLPVICAVVGGLVLAGRRWAPRGAVVSAAGFACIHAIGLVDLLLIGTSPTLALARSLQWQLGTGFLFLWLGILWCAFRLAGCVESPPA